MLVDRSPFYKFFHKLFGWDYILFHYGFGENIKRVKVAPNGLQYIKMGMNIYYLNHYRGVLNQPSNTRFGDPIPYIALT